MPFRVNHRKKPDIFYRSSETIQNKQDFNKKILEKKQKKADESVPQKPSAQR